MEAMLSYSGTMSVHVGGPVNMLATNKDSSMIVVGGRTVFKLYSIDSMCFTERINMRVGRRQGLSLSCADVAWNHVNENLIATAATNGHIMLWDLNLMSRNKQLAEFLDHKRTVTKINFHNSEPGRLLSGSQDCTMKMFDVRKKFCVASFPSKNDGVRCVQFCPHEYFQFAASFDNGSVQVWDYRNTATFLTQFIAHKGSVYTLEWHPEFKEKQKMATGGRDNKIKVWDLSENMICEHVVIPTHSLVAMARWRPLCRDQIASVAMMLDHSINVWDTRRPYVPFAHFTEHSDVATGVVWKKGDPEVLYSCSKDGLLYQHSMKDASRPAEHCNMSSLALSCKGSLSYASAEGIATADATRNIRKQGIFGFRTVVSAGMPSKAELSLNALIPGNNTLLGKFLNSRSDFAVHTAKRNGLLKSPALIEAATSYKLCKLPFRDLCSYNAEIAERLGLFQDSNIWKHIGVLFEELISKVSSLQNMGSVRVSMDKTLPIPRDIPKNSTIATESNGDESEQHSDPETEHYLTDIARGNATSEQDCYFSDDDVGEEDFDNAMSSSLLHETWLPTEAMEKRLVYQASQSLEVPVDSSGVVEVDGLVTTSPVTIPESNVSFHRLKKKTKGRLDTSKPELPCPNTTMLATCPVVHIKYIGTPSIKDELKTKLLMSVFENVLNCFTGIQIVSCSIIVLHHYCPSLELPIEKCRIEHLLNSYMNLISKFELWNHYTEIIRLTSLSSIRSVNSASVVHSSCTVCNKYLTAGGRWICSKHKDPDHREVGLGAGVKCSFCHLMIKSMYLWCQGCGHGGHMECMEKWYSSLCSKGRCPSGCGHVCTKCL